MLQYMIKQLQKMHSLRRAVSGAWRKSTVTKRHGYKARPKTSISIIVPLVLHIQEFQQPNPSLSPTPHPTFHPPVQIIGYLILFPEAFWGGLARAVSLSKTTPKTETSSWDLTRPGPQGKRIANLAIFAQADLDCFIILPC